MSRIMTIVREDSAMTTSSATPAVATPVRILDAAVDLFYQQGFRGTTIRNIVDRVGLTPGSVYVHYSSKDALLEKIIARTNDELGQCLAAAKKAADSGATAQVAAFVRGFADYVSEHRKVSLVADSEWRHLHGAELEAVREIRRALASEFSKLIGRGVRAGEFTLPVGAEGRDGAWLVAVAIISQITRIATQPERLKRGKQVPVADTYVDLALRQLGTKVPTTKKSPRGG
jgi:AcrR family transcriptional regulator